MRTEKDAVNLALRYSQRTLPSEDRNSQAAVLLGVCVRACVRVCVCACVCVGTLRLPSCIRFVMLKRTLYIVSFFIQKDSIYSEFCMGFVFEHHEQ
jgi:hypothetical protein